MLHIKKKNYKRKQQNHEQNRRVNATQKKKNLLLFSPTLLLWDLQKSLDYKHEGPTQKTIKQLQCFYRPPTSTSLCKVCVSQKS